ncbi:hypothetical protein [Xanthomonas campestris]|uniref:hypothetical protein n=1 Tax=Xanthomonas campestris TaxID=339 RepID=UPI003CF6ED8F
MPTDSEINRLLNAMTKATVSNELSWDMVPAPGALESGTNDIFPVYLQTKYKSQVVGLYERRYKDYFSDFDSFLWTSRIGIAFFDQFRRVAWEHEEPSVALNNLFQVARDSASGIDDIFSNLLN